MGLSFYRFRGAEGRIYGADLLGAGIGALSVLALLFVLSPMNALGLAGALGLAAASIAIFRQPGQSRRWAVLALVAAVAVPVALPLGWAELELSPYKGLSQSLRVAGARVIDRRSSPLGEVTVVENFEIPFRYAPGLGRGPRRGDIRSCFSRPSRLNQVPSSFEVPAYMLCHADLAAYPRNSAR